MISFLHQRLSSLFKLYTGILFTILLIPPMYVTYLSLHPTPSPIILVPESFTLEHFRTLFQNPQYASALKTTVIVSGVTAIITTILGLLAAKSYMKVGSRLRGWLLPFFISPVLVPGIILGLALLAFFKLTHIPTGIPTMIISSVAWSLPFSVLIYLTVMSNFDPTLRQASYDLGGSRLYTFWKVELPLIYSGVLGSLLFGFLLSFNEFIRGSFVSGQDFTISVLIWTTVSGGTARPEFYAASALMLVLTVGFLGTYVYLVNYR